MSLEILARCERITSRFAGDFYPSCANLRYRDKMALRWNRFPLRATCAIIPRQKQNRFSEMLKVKDTLRATVNLTFDGRVIKAYHGPNAAKRFTNEVRVLRHLANKGCTFVPKLLEANADKLRIVTTNCGSRVEHLDEPRRKELFAELEKFGVRHDDPDIRNVTYRQTDGRFCVIDFEFATILADSE